MTPEVLKYFPYRAKFDFECYFKRETEHPRNTAKLKWEAEHISLSVSVCSNVPGYDAPQGKTSRTAASHVLSCWLFTITVRFLVHSHILDIAKVTSIEVKVHGIRVGTVGALYQLGPNIGLVFILVIESTCLYT